MDDFVWRIIIPSFFGICWKSPTVYVTHPLKFMTKKLIDRAASTSNRVIIDLKKNCFCSKSLLLIDYDKSIDVELFYIPNIVDFGIFLSYLDSGWELKPEIDVEFCVWFCETTQRPKSGKIKKKTSLMPLNWNEHNKGAGNKITSVSSLFFFVKLSIFKKQNLRTYLY